MSYQARKILMPGASQKRKERDSFHGSTSLKPLVQQHSVSLATTSSRGRESQSPSSNRILAGYMAYEFLTKGTLFGERFDSSRSEAMPLNSASESKRNKQIQNRSQPNEKLNPHSYAEVANLLKMDGAHIPGIVNPTQLSRWIQM